MRCVAIRRQWHRGGRPKLALQVALRAYAEGFSTKAPGPVGLLRASVEDFGLQIDAEAVLS
eukprot:6957193-Alexandrium_andersonii.AAC.1